MAGMKDAFYGDTPAPYPSGPGWKERDGSTSRLAARTMSTSVTTLRAAALNAIIDSPAGLTADEVAAKLNHTVHAIRPRVTELGNQNKIVKSGRTRPNESGRQAAVWIPKPMDA